MSVDFTIRGERSSEDTFNVSNVNAREILSLLGIALADPSDLYGEIAPSDLRARAGRALLRLQTADGRAFDGGTDEQIDGRVIMCARRPGYFADRLRQLCDLADRAGGRSIVYG